jgi:chemotaxis protein histidine kinase CheA
VAIQGDPGQLGSSSQQLFGLASKMDVTHSGIGSAFDALTGWQGSGASQASAAGQAAQSHLDQARASLTAAHQALTKYQLEVEQAQQGWNRSENEEQQLKAELASARAQLAAARASLASIEAKNAAAQQAYANAQVAAQFQSSSLSLTASPFGSVAPPTLIPTAAVQGQIAQLQQKIQRLEDEIKTREKWKQQYETRAQQASAKVASELNSAEQLWPAAGYGSWNTNGWTAKSCLVGFNPAPASPGGPSFLGMALTVGTTIITIPLDETGAGEAIDAGVASAELGSEGAAVADSASTAADVTSSIDASPRLVKYAQAAGRSDQRGLDNLVSKLQQSQGDSYMTIGTGTKSVPGLPGVLEARAASGARVYFKVDSQGSIEILGKSVKGRSQDVVMQELRKIHG